MPPATDRFPKMILMGLATLRRRIVSSSAQCRLSNKRRVQILPRSGPIRSCPAIANHEKSTSLTRLRTRAVVAGVLRKQRERPLSF